MGSNKIKVRQKPCYPVQYMDVKYLSECVEMERRYVRLIIREWRKGQQGMDRGNIVSFGRYQRRLAVMKSFYRYAYVTRLYHETRRQYLKQIAEKY